MPCQKITLLLCSCLIIIKSATAAPPTFDYHASRYVTWPEDTPVGTVIKQFNVTDSDPGDNIRISAGYPTTAEYITLNQTHGNNIRVLFFLRRVLDRDRGTTNLKLRFAAVDNTGNKVYLEFTLYIEDVNDEAPVFTHEPFRVAIPENHPKGSVFAHVSATDLDGGLNGYVTYVMKSQSHNETFSISNITGELTLLKTLDYEKTSYYQFTVVAQDMTPPYHQVSTLLIIHVLDVQDTPPFFTVNHPRAEIPENMPLGSTVTKVSAVDGDTGVSDGVDFQVLDGDCSSFFTVDSNGIITIAKSLDRDVGEIKNNSGVCLLRIQAFELNATQPQYGNTTANTTVMIIIDDVDDNKPTFLNNTTTFLASVYENSPVGTVITFDDPTEMTVEDLDQGINAKVYVTLTNPAFTVAPSTVYGYGSFIIKVADASVLDRELQDFIDFQVLIRGEKDQKPSTVANVTVQLLDENDNVPVFRYLNYSFDVIEETPMRTFVGKIEASDPDRGSNGEITYSLENKDRFRINSSGYIFVDSTLDAETMSDYHFIVVASDGGQTPRTSSVPVTIHVLDINDNAPVFMRNNYTVLVKKNDIRHIPSPLITIQAIDADVTAPNDIVTYSFKAFSEQWMNNNMKVNNQTGEVSFKSPIDVGLLENHDGTPRKLTAIIEAKDHGTPSRSSQASLNVIIQGVSNIPDSSSRSSTTQSAIVQYNTNSQPVIAQTTMGHSSTSHQVTTSLPPTSDVNKCNIIDALKVKKLQLEIELLRTQLRKLNA